MRIIVSGGGTIGHVSPVLATVDALQEHASDLQVLFVGSPGGVESRLAAEAGLPFVAILGGKFRRLPNAGWRANLRQIDDLALNLLDLIKIAWGTLQAIWVVGKFRPQVAFNKAGPTGIPLGLACRLWRVPMVIHEPDAIPGWGNRVLSRWAAAIAVGFPKRYYIRIFDSKRTFYTGTPIHPQMRQELERVESFGFDPKRPLTVVVGGSQGARRLNEAVLAHLPELLEETQILHITGARNYDEVGTAARNQGFDFGSGYRIEPSLSYNQLASAYQLTTLVVARGGANTIAELAAKAKPLILVPNQEAAAHQVKNAAIVADQNAALVVDDSDPEALFQAITKLIKDDKKRSQLGQKLAELDKPQAASQLAKVILEVAKP